MEYCSPLLAGSPASHPAQLDAVETKAFNITGISHAEAESMGLSLSHHREVSGLSVFYLLLSGLAPSALSVLCHPQVSAGCIRSINPLLVKLPKSRITAHLHPLVPLYSPSVEPTSTFSSISFFPPDLQASCSLPSQIIRHLKTEIFSSLINPPSPSSHPFKFPVFPS